MTLERDTSAVVEKTSARLWARCAIPSGQTSPRACCRRSLQRPDHAVSPNAGADNHQRTPSASSRVRVVPRVDEPSRPAGVHHGRACTRPETRRAGPSPPMPGMGRQRQTHRAFAKEFCAANRPACRPGAGGCLLRPSCTSEAVPELKSDADGAAVVRQDDVHADRRPAVSARAKPSARTGRKKSPTCICSRSISGRDKVRGTTTAAAQPSPPPSLPADRPGECPLVKKRDDQVRMSPGHLSSPRRPGSGGDVRSTLFELISMTPRCCSASCCLSDQRRVLRALSLGPAPIFGLRRLNFITHCSSTLWVPSPLGCLLTFFAYLLGRPHHGAHQSSARAGHRHRRLFILAALITPRPFYCLLLTSVSRLIS